MPVSSKRRPPEMRGPRITSLLSIALLGLVTPPAGAARPQEPAGSCRPFTGLDPVQPHVAVSRAGKVYAVCIAGREARDVWLAASDDGGAHFGTPVMALDVGGHATGGLQRGPRVGVDDAGHVYVSAVTQLEPWGEGQRYPQGDVWLAVSGDGGQSFGAPVRVNDRAGASGHPDSEKSAKEGMHWMHVAREGVVHLTWLDHRLAPGRGQLLAYARVGDAGQSVGENVLAYVPPETICQCCTPAIAADGRGNPTLAFRNAVGDGREIWTVASKDGGRSFGEARRVTEAPSGIPG